LTNGTILANLGYEKVVHPNPVFHGNMVYVESEVLEKREPRSRPDCGTVRLKHIGRKPDKTVVIEMEWTVLFYRQAVRQDIRTEI